MSQWHPIETAPTDGTRVIYWHKNYEIPIIGFYRDGYIYGGNIMFEPSAIPREWHHVATHWMPLPRRPTNG